MRVLVATKNGELVMPLFCWEIVGTCFRAELCELHGVQTLESTTCFRIEEQSITLHELSTFFFKALKREKWIQKNPSPVECSSNLEEGQKIANAFAGAISRVASRFPVGDILSKKRSMFYSQKNRTRKARMAIRSFS